jgi:hypothetical protein
MHKMRSQYASEDQKQLLPLYAVFHVVELLSLGHHRDTRQKGQIEEQHCFWVCTQVSKS